MSNIVLKDRQGIKQTYSGVEVIKIADSEGNYNNYVAEPTGEIKITANGSVDVSKYARARVAVPSGSVAEWDGTGVVITPIEPEEPEQPMTFTINGTSYQMENRMTWYAWTRSDYNIDGFACVNENDYVYEAESTNKVTDADGNDVLGTTYIVEGGAYRIKEAVTTDELAGTWVFNHNLYDVGSTSLKWKGLVQVPFSSGTYGNLEGMKIGNGTLSYCISVSQSKFVNNGASVYSSLNGGTWNTSVYKTITILSDDVTTDTSIWSVDDFKAWLKANATKQAEATTILSIYHNTGDGPTYTFNVPSANGTWDSLNGIVSNESPKISLQTPASLGDIKLLDSTSANGKISYIRLNNSYIDGSANYDVGNYYTYSTWTYAGAGN